MEERGRKRAGRWMRQVHKSRGKIPIDDDRGKSDGRRGGELGGGTSVGGGREFPGNRERKNSITGRKKINGSGLGGCGTRGAEFEGGE